MSRLLCMIAALAGFWLLAGCAVNPVTGERQLTLFSLSPEEEAAIGARTFPRAMQSMGGRFPDRQLSDYVNRVGGRLGSVSHRPGLDYTFAVVNDSSPNAFALPGGYIALTRGLLVNLENEAQMAAVLGHEVAHVTARHASQGLQRSTLLGVAQAVVSGATEGSGYGVLAEQGGALAASLIDRSYSREQERESDRLGIDYMVEAGYDPQGAVQLQEFFADKVEGQGNSSWLTGLFRTHPFSRERLKANREYIRQNYRNSLGGPSSRLGVEAFNEATASLRKTREGYRLYDQAQQLEASGNVTEAIDTYLDAIEAAPDQALIYTGLGLAHLRLDDLLPARRYLLEAVRLDDSYFRSQSALGYVYLKRESPEKAVSHLEKAMELLPTANSAFLLAESYEKTGRPDKALELYRAVRDADPGSEIGRAADTRIESLEKR
ncbi:MAG: M48 family metalloprotease [Desulfuromonadales bacterium]